MHLPDGILPLNQAIIYWLIGLIFFGYYFIKFRKSRDNQRLVNIAIFSAIVAVCSGISIPTPFGASIHFFLIPLAAILLGPYSGVVVTFIALSIQALGLGMGGILALGCNVLVMGVILSFVTYYTYKLMEDFFNKSVLIFLSTLTGIIFASISQMIIIMFSGTGNFELLILTLIPFYILVGIIEGFGNVVIIEFMEKLKPEIFDLEKI